MDSTSPAGVTVKGYKTTEFWLTVATSVVALLNQAFGWNIPPETVATVAGIVASYVFSRMGTKRAVISSGATAAGGPAPLRPGDPLFNKQPGARNFTIAIAFALIAMIASSSRAGDSTSSFEPSPFTKSVTELVDGAASARAFSVAVYPTYAPKLANHWGAGGSILYPFGDYAFTGLRFDLLDGSYFAASASVGAKADVKLFGHTFTPFALTGVVTPLANAGDETLEPGAIVGAGLSTMLWKVSEWDGRERFKVSAFVEAEYWTQYPGVQIFHGGLQASLSW